MNAEEFYQEFKEMLDYLGPGFNGKINVKVSFAEGKFAMEYGSKVVMLFDPTGSKK